MSSMVRALGRRDPEVDPAWRRGVVALGTGSAVIVAIGMLGHLTPPTSLTLAVGLAAWCWELFRTPYDPRAEGALIVVVGASGALLNALASDSPGFVLAFLAVAAAGLRFDVRPGVLLLVTVVALTDAGIAATSTHPLGSLTSTDLGLTFVFVAAAATRRARAAEARTRELLAELEASRAAQAEAAVLAERSRLAREIHDILAHALSGQVMSLEATRLLADRTGADARVVEEIARAHGLAKAGLADARRAIGALRGDEVPGPDRIPQLVEEARAAHGLRAEYEVSGTPRPVPTEVSLSLYRTAQESLTNTTKHGGRGATSRLRLCWEPDRVELTATDIRRPGVAAVPGDPSSSGYGLTGLRERAELAGGTLETRERPDGFTVHLCLPLAPRPEEGDQA